MPGLGCPENVRCRLAEEKLQAYQFFTALEGYLNERLPSPTVLAGEIKNIVINAKHDDSRKHMRSAESAFLNHFVVPHLFRYVSEHPGMDSASARASLLSENYRHMAGFTSGTPARSEGHPFRKALGVRPEAVVRQWRGETPGKPLVQACPDFALRDPFPFRVVFEGKYFAQGSPEKAEVELATDLYQAFFYLGLPHVAAKGKRAPWNYVYSCLLAFDASPTGALRATWHSLDKHIRRGFWTGANIYVMILRGSDRPVSA
jgi:hypothetical protein